MRKETRRTMIENVIRAIDSKGEKVREIGERRQDYDS